MQAEKDNSKASEQEKQAGNSPPGIDGARIISYNFNEDERPGGIKVRAKIRIASGQAAGTLDRAQAEAIRELLLWTRAQRTQGPRR
jgi:hypothetical protein